MEEELLFVGGKCISGCVHFKHGAADVYWAWDDSGYFPSVRKPVCKLWK